ncbi:cell wall hydrolase [Sphingomonas arenae]|uniref:cell wall hydrolase n=1 Tax=Sphingomonas arenae TaxID=2812555 RepID=UPI001967D07A|nr:cell wall hydrolase [Sphingomonas arenae]
MRNFLSAGRVPAIAAVCLTIMTTSGEAQAQVAAASAGVLKVDYQLQGAVAQPGAKTASVTPGVSSPGTAVSYAQPRSAVLSSAVRPQSGVTPPAGATPIQPAVTQEGLWPLIWANMQGPALDEELNCVAVAIYHEARGEPFPGQLAVAEVIMNRARSGRYPTTLCGVVKQPWQFSFVRGGRFPAVNASSASWSYAQAIARIAANRLADALPEDVLWYHADYVAPSWGRRLSRVEKIGAHIFYRS